MSVPTYDKFIEPLLRFLAAKPGEVHASDAHEAAAASLGIAELVHERWARVRGTVEFDLNAIRFRHLHE